jgi:hypothetical protein
MKTESKSEVICSGFYSEGTVSVAFLAGKRKVLPTAMRQITTMKKSLFYWVFSDFRSILP